MLTKVWTVQHLEEMLEPEQNQNHLIEVLERLCLAVENLTEDLRPELKKTATLERKKQEAKEIEIAAAKAVAKWKDKKRNTQQS
mgnify:CR=1 FL=1